MNITFSEVTKTFEPDITALFDISLNIEQGEFVYVIGQTGSGKSTLLRLITRELLPSAGTVAVGGFDLRRMRRADVPYYRRDVGLVAQDFKLISSLTVYENIAFVMEAMSVPKRIVAERTRDVINQVGLWRRRFMRPAQLSGGEQQRVAIARALANSPSLFIADEPTGNLDFHTAAEVMKILFAINAAGVTVVMSTHNQSIVNSSRQRVIELDNGKLIRDEKGGLYQA
ncbi:MAG: ATP-binding cassette domain-containing protein [Synergistales bacterium]|nr:ATP-binding cassette domain-containing protein [Synergistales bacterium]MDY6400747.1 ATP-binding cassette domain-containing protein [Synergistales bacterium]MDY6404577.1 ATP-binding cassette domain-containing protein [Synergistales bacterium]MDY6411203.1 ATP-binding cassette domain-containing protein [Synergistales bacterium]MDY6413599.1 ATP-binding cassette domain-containing protein [Synergistales bacterium]